MSANPEQDGLSRRERQIMHSLYRLGSASAAEIHEAIPDAPSYTAVRTLLTILCEKGHVRFTRNGAKYIYEPVVSKQDMAKSVMEGVIENFFEGSIERVVATLIDREESNLTDDQLARLSEMIEQARKQGR